MFIETLDNTKNIFQMGWKKEKAVSHVLVLYGKICDMNELCLWFVSFSKLNFVCHLYSEQ